MNAFINSLLSGSMVHGVGNGPAPVSHPVTSSTLPRFFQMVAQSNGNGGFNTPTKDPAVFTCPHEIPPEHEWFRAVNNNVLQWRTDTATEVTDFFPTEMGKFTSSEEGAFGPEISYLYYLNKLFGGLDRWNKSAFNETEISAWLPGGDRHTRFFADITAMGTAIGGWNTVSYLGMMDQGESDAKISGSVSFAQGYYNRCGDFINLWRSAIGYDFPILVREQRLDISASFPFIPYIIEAWKKIAKDLPNIYIIPVNKPKLWDGIHYDQYGQIEKGIVMLKDKGMFLYQ